MPRSYCTVPDCDEPHFARSLCSKHYGRWQRGKKLPIPVRDAYHLTVAERFWSKVNKDGPIWRGSPCWLWTASSGGKGGYGQFQLGGGKSKMVRAHRWSYEAVVGFIPEGLELDHLCRVRLCVNPSHLEPVTHRENDLRAHHLRQTCYKGHPLDGFRKAGTGRAGSRYCKTCRQASNRRYSQKVKHN